MSIFKKRNYYKPFAYPWAFEAYDMQQKMHWLPSEVSLHEDINDWNNRMSESEKNLVKQILTFFTQGDVDVAQAYMDVYIPLFKPLEIRMMLSAIATNEAVHAHAYSLLNDTVGMDDSDYQAFQEIKINNLDGDQVSVFSYFEALENAIGEVRGQIQFAIDVNGRLTGMFIEGSENASSITLAAESVKKFRLGFLERGGFGVEGKFVMEHGY